MVSRFLVRLTVIVLLGVRAIMWFPNLFTRRKRRNEALGKGISLIVPFRGDGAERTRNWDWLLTYWETALPKAEIIVSANLDSPFCKTKAVNAGFRLATGDVIAILDADAYLDAEVLLEAAERIRADRTEWFVPYRRLYRLNAGATDLIAGSDPADPLKFADPPPASVYVNESGQSVGHHYGAMVQIFPREAFEAVNGMDERFTGWGGEDISFMRSVDTMYARHKTLDSPVFHLFHPTSAGKWYGTKTWQGQGRETNSKLTTRYNLAFNDPSKMRKLIGERDG
jgi:glycosyltransferase involved in cell wall biosynthesis